MRQNNKRTRKRPTHEVEQHFLKKTSGIVIWTLAFTLIFSLSILAFTTFFLPLERLHLVVIWERLCCSLIGLIGGYLLGIISAKMASGK